VVTQYEEGRTIARAVKKTGSDDLERQKVREALDPSVARLVADAEQ
jgi:hypothetical protein